MAGLPRVGAFCRQAAVAAIMAGMNGPISRWETLGELTDNGVGLGSLHKGKTSAVTPVPDQAGRTALYNRVPLAFEWRIQFDPHAAVGPRTMSSTAIGRAPSRPATSAGTAAASG